jgi:hypothetical protein
VSARAQLVVNGAPGPIEPLAPGRFARFPRRPAEDAHVRVHVLRPDGTTLAITNPVFVRKGP